MNTPVRVIVTLHQIQHLLSVPHLSISEDEQLREKHISSVQNECLVTKPLVHFQNKKFPHFTHPHVIKDVRVFLSSVEKK